MKEKNNEKVAKNAIKAVHDSLKVPHTGEIYDEIHLVFAKQTKNKNDGKYVIYDELSKKICHVGTKDNLVPIWDMIVNYLEKLL